MTITEKEAARILDPETSRDALWEYEEEDRLEACNEACRVAAAVLSAQPPKLDRSRWEGCPYCKDAKHDCVPYCQYCGTPQTEDAWAELERRIGGTDDQTD